MTTSMANDTYKDIYMDNDRDKDKFRDNVNGNDNNNGSQFNDKCNVDTRDNDTGTNDAHTYLTTCMLNQQLHQKTQGQVETSLDDV